MATPETGTQHHDHDHDDHDHDHHGHGAHGHSDHGHSHAVPDSLRAFAIGAGLNFGFVIVEVIFGLYAGSLALLADAGHNLSDVLGLLLAWGAAWLSRRAPTRLRTYGYGRSSILAALANAMILLLGTGGIILEAISRLSQPEPVETGIVMVVALVGVAVNMGTALMFMAGRKGDLNVRGAFIHMVADGAISLGVVAAAGVIALTGWLWLDPLVSLVIAVAIIAGTWGLLRDSVNLAMDKVPTGIDPERVEAFLATRPGVSEVHDLHIWGLSTTSVALSAHLVRPGAALDDDFLSETCAELRARFGIAHPVLQIEQGRMACALAPRDMV
ncbi:cation diffusion facilitator family transporter [Xanthobacter versatilis]|uniref:Cation diffusion facilitator family transporter n=1 Tax=Xanthobacter autotrophicus (strain ATCC BAA-1158 / Py2) TaxID=78245 RepID=A7IL12_XANP2|nr:cation diffusion facilitator family transporter [Xanthobacter autotrophicus Py2]